jgi:pyruvate dehydrogenase E2 component (dihydrolipoamide acetyltransferase)
MLQDADKKGLGTIAEEVKQLAQKARDNSLKPADYEVWNRSTLWLLS